MLDFGGAMGAISNLRRCRDLNEDHAAEAACSAEKLRQLVERVAQVAQPGDGGATLLVTLERIASSSRWVDGGLCIEIVGDDVDSTLEIYTDHGATRERIVPATPLAIPVDDFLLAVEKDPDLVGSLRVEMRPHRLTLSTRASGEIPITWEIAEESLQHEARDTRPAPADFDAPRRMSGMHERFDLLVEPPACQTVYTKTTVPKMAAVTPDAIRRHDPRREPDA
jgi:hypothetical protein